MKKLTLLCTAALLALNLSAQAAKDKDIVETAQSTGTFTTLVAALKAADKAEMLKEDGPYTVFAPTDEAFNKLPKGTVESLLKPENKEKLAGILAYHVVEGKVMAADVKTMKADTAHGAQLDVKVSGSNVTVNNAKVVKTDVTASNGVIHVIDTVLMPPTKG
ncbi:fasciclin domain-containing protein [soil metagenome]